VAQGEANAVTTATDVMTALGDVASPAFAVQLQGYFKTGPGEYGEGDVFIGVRLPAMRKIAKQFRHLELDAIDELLDSEIHEHRACALLILGAEFERGIGDRAEIVARYLAALQRGRVNNWDLVDSSAGYILGSWLIGKDRSLLFDLAASESLWDRRVAMIATSAFTWAGDPSATIELAEVLLPDRADLIQKAVGWMLRDVGKRVDRDVLTGFLDRHAASMGRTALSYATEHLTPEERARYRAMKPT
jgi:3-methyladenine DNA glycosylase AlkD